MMMVISSFRLLLAPTKCLVSYDSSGVSISDKSSFILIPHNSNFISTNFTPCFSYHQTYISMLRNVSLGLVDGFFQVLHVKGIGFKVFYHNVTHCVYFSLGYTHFIRYKLDDKVVVKVRKSYLLLFSNSIMKLNQTIIEIQKLRYPDPYRGKGIRFRFQVMKFKPGKQR